MTRVTRLTAVICLPVLLALSACGAVEDKARSAASSAVNKGVSAAAEAIVASAFTEAATKAGVTLDGNPDCSSDLDTDVKGLTVKGTVTCAATTDKGKAASSTFKGVIAVGSSATSCKGRFVLKVDGKAKVDKDVDVCEVAKGN